MGVQFTPAGIQVLVRIVPLVKWYQRPAQNWKLQVRLLYGTCKEGGVIVSSSGSCPEDVGANPTLLMLGFKSNRGVV